MSLVVGEGIGKYYGGHDVFKNLSFRIEQSDSIGLVGANGEGKTTLLCLLAGLEHLTNGTLNQRRDLRLGYLPQDPPNMGETTLWEVMLQVFAGVRRLGDELAGLAGQLEDPSCSKEILQRYSNLQQEFERCEGYTYESRIRTVLSGLGFEERLYDHPLSQLSGGQRTRALLAQLLLDEPDLLLLDEPTNHLDLQAVEWLESWVQDFKGSLVVVSHDRYFLDRVTNRTWELAFGQLEAYRGNYSAYLHQRHERYERRLKEWQAQQEYIEKNEEFIRRYIAGQRTKEAQGRRVRLQRFMEREAIEKPRRHRRIRVRLEEVRRSGDIVLQLSNLKAGYELDKPIVQVAEEEIRRGERVALIGANGAGKTTLVKSMLKELEWLSGEIRYGANVEMGYLPQDHQYLKPEMSVLDAVRQVRPQLLPDQIRSLMGSFLFTGDDVFKRIDELSGGQRSRVALARLVVREANLLILDEPTNHLDIASQEVLEKVLKAFPGTLILVSHDRYLIQALATHIWRVGDGYLNCFKGNWEDYVEQRTKHPSPHQVAADGQPDRQVQRLEQKEARRRRKEMEKKEARQGEIEAAIQRSETQLGRLSQDIGRAGEAQDVDQVRQLGDEYRQLERQLEVLWKEWEELAGEL